MTRRRYVLAGVLLVLALAFGCWLGVTFGRADPAASQVEAAREFWGWVLVGLGALFVFCLVLLYAVLTWKR